MTDYYKKEAYQEPITKWEKIKAAKLGDGILCSIGAVCEVCGVHYELDCGSCPLKSKNHRKCYEFGIYKKILGKIAGKEVFSDRSLFDEVAPLLREYADIVIKSLTEELEKND